MLRHSLKYSVRKDYSYSQITFEKRNWWAEETFLKYRPNRTDKSQIKVIVPSTVRLYV